METSETGGGGLSFERATYTAQSGGGTACANCKGPLGERYWHWQSRAVCEACRDRLNKVLEASQSKKAFGRALLLGGATALGCGVAYAVFVALTRYQLALITIGIAFVVAKVMRACSGGIGGRKYQVLAVVLTYLASTMGYAPGVLSGFNSAVKEHQTEAAQPAAQRDGPNGAGDGAPTSEGKKAGLGAYVVSLAVLLGFTLAAPFLAATEAPIGLLIVGFGLWEAWKLSRALPLSLDGPYRTAEATGPPAK